VVVRHRQHLTQGFEDIVAKLRREPLGGQCDDWRNAAYKSAGA
jgi:hypothetical protein